MEENNLSTQDKNTKESATISTIKNTFSTSMKIILYTSILGFIVIKSVFYLKSPSDINQINSENQQQLVVKEDPNKDNSKKKEDSDRKDSDIKDDSKKKENANTKGDPSTGKDIKRIEDSEN